MTEWDARKYAQISDLQAAMAAEVLALAQLNGNERVLDVGCGNGRVTSGIAAKLLGGSVRGVDASRDMIAFAQSQYPATTHPNLAFEVADARDLKFENEFDLVVSFNALHWVPDQERALRGIRAALKPGGRAQLRLVPLGPRKSLETVLEETRKSPRWAQYFSGFSDPYLRLTQDEYAALAARCGFHVDRVHTGDKLWDFGSHEAFCAFGSVTFVEWSRKIPEDQKSAFITDVLDRYRAAVSIGPTDSNTFRFYQMDIALSLR